MLIWCRSDVDSFAGSRKNLTMLMNMANRFRGDPECNQITINALVEPALESVPRWLAPVVARAEVVGPSEFPSVSPKVTASSASLVLSACLSGKGSTAQCMASKHRCSVCIPWCSPLRSSRPCVVLCSQPVKNRIPETHHNTTQGFRAGLGLGALCMHSCTVLPWAHSGWLGYPWPLNRGPDLWRLSFKQRSVYHAGSTRDYLLSRVCFLCLQMSIETFF
jgi:hypothetical protein